jgi:hypothetical protein
MGTARSLLVSYLFLFIWRREFSGRDVMYHLWSQIAGTYRLSS